MFKPNSIFLRILKIEPVRRQSIVSFTWSIVLFLIGPLSTVYFAHTIGASVLGVYFLFVAYSSIITALSDLGFGGAMQKRVAEGEEPDAYYSVFFTVRTLVLVVVIAALFVFRGYFVDINSAGVFVLLPMAVIVSVYYGAIHGSIAGRGKMGIYSTAQFINEVSRIAIQILAVLVGFGAAGLMGGFIVAMVIVAIMELRFFDMHLVRFSSRHFKSLSSLSFWMFLNVSGLQVFAYADTVLIGYFLSNADVGVYRVVLQLAAVGAFTTTALLTTLWPKVNRWGKVKEVGLIEQSLSRAFSYSLILAVPVLAGGILLGDRLLYYLYGSEFTRGYTVLLILLCLQVVNIFKNFFVTYLNALNYLKEAFTVILIGATANILLDLILIPAIGIEGAAVAAFLTMTLNMYLAWHMLSKAITIRIERSSVVNILKASLVMAMFILVYRGFIPLSSVWLTLAPVFFGGAIYGILILKLDSKIYDELKGIVTQMNLPWPNWL